MSHVSTSAPAITLCSTLDLTGKTVLFKLPEYTVATLPASHPLAIVTDGNTSSSCTVGGGANRVLCHWNGSAWQSLGGGGGVGDPGANGVTVRTAVNTLVARTLTGTANRIVVTNGDGVAGAPTFNTGTDVAHKSEANSFTGINDFTATLRVPRKATPGDPSTLSAGEVFVDGALIKYKSDTGVLYTLLKLGDSLSRLFSSATNPTVNDDVADGYVVTDLWFNTATAAFFIISDTTEGAANWNQIYPAVLNHNQLGALSADDHSDIYTKYVSSVGIPAPGSCGRDGQLQFNTGGLRTYGCYTADGDPRDLGEQGDSFYSVTNGSDSADCEGGCTLVLTGSAPITVGTPTAASMPDGTVTVNLSLANHVKSVSIPADALYMQGCTKVTGSALVTGGLTEPYVTCGDNDAHGFHRTLKMPDSWNGGTITVTLGLINVNAAPANDYEIDFSAVAIPLGTALATTIATTGEQPATVDFDANGTCGVSACAQFAYVKKTTGAITVNGTPAGGNLLRIQGQVDATATTTAQVADVKILEITIEYTVTGAGSD